MSEPKFTKGEWFVLENDMLIQICVNNINNTDERYNLDIASVNNDYPSSFEDAKANAQLISAAPDLLEACELAWATIKSLKAAAGIPNEQFSVEPKLKKAIAKAKGENL
jgi:hypothetical protein